MHYDDRESTTPEPTTPESTTPESTTPESTTLRPIPKLSALPPDPTPTPEPPQSPVPDFAFPFERLHAYRLLVDVARWVRAQQWPPHTTDLRDQALRASSSMVLNTAEGCQVGGRQGKNQLRIASGSAAEVVAVLDVIDLPGGAAQQRKLRRAGAMIRKLR